MPRLAKLSVRRFALLLLVALAPGIAGCGEDAPPVSKLTPAEVEAQLATTPAGQPETLREIGEEAGETIDPGAKNPADVLAARVAALEGTPVVVNVWADWCKPCKTEMPIFQRVALAHRGEIGFLGVASQAKQAKTEAYLRDVIAMPYPSIADEDGKVIEGTGVDGLPKTFFYDRAGKRTVHNGPYESAADLLADIKRYAQ